MASSAISATGRLLRRTGAHLRREAARLAAGLALLLLGLGGHLLFPQLLRVLIDSGIEGGDAARIHHVAWLLVGLLVLQSVAVRTRVRLLTGAAERVAAEVRAQVLGRLLRQETAFFDRHDSAELAARTQQDAVVLQRLVAETGPEALYFSLMAVGVGAVMIVASPLLSCGLLLAAPVLYALTARLGSGLRQRGGAYHDRAAAAAQVSAETLGAMRTVRIFGREEDELRRYRGALDGVVAAGEARADAHGRLEMVTSVASEALVLLTVWLGGVLIARGSLTRGELASFAVYALMEVRALRNVANAGAALLGADGATERLFALADREPRMPLAGGEVPAPRARGALALRGVCFGYETREGRAALQSIDLRVEPGEAVAIVGASGAGKSTLARLCARLYDPDAGEITLDGARIDGLDPRWLRRQVMLVHDGPELFSRSVAENIRYGDLGADAAEIERVARVAEAHDFIAALPDGYATEVGDRGVQLSTGQRQRIALARALLPRPAVLILDEALSGIDAETEAAIKAKLRALPERPALIFIAHRLSTVQDVDRIYVLEGGRVVAAGSHAELLARCASYRQLIADQLAA